jgi:hypothetical protein
MTYWLHTSTIVGYSFNAENFCTTCTRDAWGHTHQTVEQALDDAAQRLAIDRGDESSYDSNDFPKVIFAGQVEDSDERCARCHERLLDR